MAQMIDHGTGIHAIDAQYTRHQFAAIHLIVDAGRAAFVDTGTNGSIPGALAALSHLGLSPADVDYVLLTHIHLDHAGGAGTLMAACPNAKLAVHPRGARHMIDPGKLMAATEEVYGREQAQRLYGRLLPIDAARVIEVGKDGEGETLTLGSRTLQFHDSPGHAKHHVFIHDPKARAIFTGDTFGISYRECDVTINGQVQPFLFPSSTPSQFDPAAMRDSVQRMLACAPEAMYLTHYSRVGLPDSPPAELAQALLRRLDAMVTLAREENTKVGTGETAVARQRTLTNSIFARLTAYLLKEARAHGVALTDEQVHELWRMDLELDAQGLALWAAS